MIESLPTPEGPEMMTSCAPARPSTARTISALRCVGRRARRLEARATSSSGKRRLERARARRSTGRDELEPPGVQEEPLEAQPARAARGRARTPGRPRPGGRSTRGAPAPGACGRSRGRPRAASTRRSARARGSRSPPGLPSATTAMRMRSRGSRPMGFSMRPTCAATGPADERLVRLLHAARLQLRLQRDLGRVVARDDEQAARVAVEPMDDARAA